MDKVVVVTPRVELYRADGARLIAETYNARIGSYNRTKPLSTGGARAGPVT